MIEVLLLFAEKQINPVHMSCQLANKYVLELCVMNPTVIGSTLGKVRERREKSKDFITHQGNPLIIHTAKCTCM